MKQKTFDIYVPTIVKDGVVTKILPSYVYVPEHKKKKRKEKAS